MPREILDKDGQPWRTRTLLELMREIEAPSELVNRTLERLINPPLMIEGLGLRLGMRPLLDQFGRTVWRDG